MIANYRWSALTRLVTLSILIAASSVASAALPGWYDAVAGKGIKPELPDLYQHEFLVNLPAVAPIPKKAGWEVGGGWCRPTALVDGLYSLQQAGYANLLPAGSNAAATWLDKTGDGISSLRAVQGTGNQQFLTNRGHGINQGVGPGKGLVFNQFYVNPTNGVVSYVSAYNQLRPLTVKTGPNTFRFETAFELYKAAMFQDQDVMVRIGDVQNYGAGKIPLHWWSGPQPLGGNYHYLNGAGIDTVNNVMFLADPDSNKGSGDANAGWGPNFNADPNVAARRYAAADPIPIPARGVNASDMPVNFGDFYSSVSVNAANGYVFAPQGNRYSGAFIQAIEAIGPLRAFKHSFLPAALKALSPGSGVSPASADVPEQIDIDSNLSDLVDKVVLFPTSTPVTGFVESFADDDTWTETDIAPNAADPFGDTRSFGGFEFDVLSNPDADPDGLEPGEMALASIATANDFTAFDVMMHDAVTDSWFVQAIGANENLATDQQVPEPGAISLLAIGAALFCGTKRNWRNRC